MKEFITLLDKWKIPYSFMDIEYYKDRFPTVKTAIEIQNSSDRLGYSGFVSEWLFDHNDNFLAMGHFE